MPFSREDRWRNGRNLFTISLRHSTRGSSFASSPAYEFVCNRVACIEDEFLLTSLTQVMSSLRLKLI